ncbi:MAG: DinB family protein [Bacteroidia bacterium]|nr:DinB family protein [Bacteroidia bacterium]NNK74045.1 DinB family protein [Flavobacteriaceae bacterium]
MNKQEIADLLETKYSALFLFLDNQSDDRWEIGPAGKWTTGQQVLHLLQSIKPLNAAMSLPKFIIRARFGTSNRELRDYDTVVKRYHERLKASNGATFRPSRQMKTPGIRDKSYLIDRLRVENKKLQYKTLKWPDKNLDQLVLPHPLMGKMPVREMLMWSAYHVEHHCNTLISHY